MCLSVYPKPVPFKTLDVLSAQGTRWVATRSLNVETRQTWTRLCSVVAETWTCEPLRVTYLPTFHSSARLCVFSWIHSKVFFLPNTQPLRCEATVKQRVQSNSRLTFIFTDTCRGPPTNAKREHFFASGTLGLHSKLHTVCCYCTETGKSTGQWVDRPNIKPALLV